jgi:hypothetical protein
MHIMPFGLQRINARRKQPNDRITFIKPLEGPDKEFAQDFLERIAAICNPIMKANHLSIMSLEEYEPNREFVGRNFNAGEVVQLVLKTHAGHWLPFKYVQMVMMHELAHNDQMNHSKAFWKVRNAYADELKVLWGRGYTGEGLWSRGVSLITGNYETNTMATGEPLPTHLCGGTYKSGKRKRKGNTPKVSYKERQQKRIAKKFGINGVALGADEETKSQLENGKKSSGKPRVARSARGRALRAAAALARFEMKNEVPVKEEEDDSTLIETDYDNDDDDDEYDYDGTERPQAMDINGKKLVDGKGRGMVRVCRDEDANDVDAINEMAELQDFDTHNKGPSTTDQSYMISKNDSSPKSRNKETIPLQRNSLNSDRNTSPNKPSITPAPGAKMTSSKDGTFDRADENFLEVAPPLWLASRQAQSSFCPVCSMENEEGAAICMACANVLDQDKVPSIWRCQTAVCQGGKYINAGDCGVCGVCGARKGGASSSI